MIDINSILLIIPPLASAMFAYLIARKKNLLDDNLSRSKMGAEIQSQALKIVQETMIEMRTELKREIDQLRTDNNLLRDEVKSSREKISSLEFQIDASDKLSALLKHEIYTLNMALRMLQDENSRLKNK